MAEVRTQGLAAQHGHLRDQHRRARQSRPRLLGQVHRPIAARPVVDAADADS